MTWLGIKLFFSQLWENIKNVPHWALVTLVLLGAIVWSLIKKDVANKKLLEIQREISDIEKELSLIHISEPTRPY